MDTGMETLAEALRSRAAQPKQRICHATPNNHRQTPGQPHAD
jgi:hypothetical protein